MQLISAALQVLAAVFFGSGGSKLAGAQRHRENFRAWGYPAWLVPGTGAAEVAAASALLAGLFVEPLALLGALLVVLVMAGALHTRLVRAREPISHGVFPAALLVAALIVGAANVPTG